jgi:SUKH-4 immunity protein of toxin-antitoxin system
MANDLRQLWPAYEVVRYAEPADFPRELALPLLQQGAPRSLLDQAYYQAAERLTLLEYPPFGLFVRFGAQALHNHMCLDPRTGAVVVLSSLPALAPGLVNNSLDRFLASVQFVSSRYPFDGGALLEGGDPDSEVHLEHLSDTVNELREGLRRIDPTVVPNEGTLWSDFLDSVFMGDWDTDVLLGNGER